MRFRGPAFVFALLFANAVGGSMFASRCYADSQINLSLVGPTTPVVVNQIIDVKLRATQQQITTLIGTSFVAIDCILQWNPKQLQLQGLVNTGSVPLLSSYFPTVANDYTGINEAIPPADGNALYYALAPLGNPVQVPLTGVQVVTFRFKVRAAFAKSTVSIAPTLTVRTVADTIVYDGTVPGLDVTGTLSSASIVQATPCPSDLDGNGTVTSSDLALLLNGWGSPGTADINGSGLVDAADLSILLSSWGACPGT
ncbi:MAG: dockerin type I domain-containing protein [Planctomycetota bacterium]